jgi:SOS-response transcriptional repressor LexA
MDELREAARDFLRRGLNKTGWTAYRWAKEAKVASTTITRLLNDPEWTNIPKAVTLQKLATAAGLELPDTLNFTATMDLSAVERSIPVLGEVRAGSWERIPDEPSVQEWLPMDVPEYAGASLFAVRVSGRSMDLLYPDGTYVVCAPPAEVGLREGDCVVVRRRNAADLAETTLKQVERKKDGSFILCPRSSDPAFQEPIQIPPRDEMDHAGVEIIGVVLVAYAKDRRGRGPLITL